MARNFKVEVAAINIRIPEDKKRDYEALIETIARTRRGVQVYGDTHVIISSYSKRENTGVISKYTEIDLDGEWFNQNSFDAATPEQLSEINIPNHLKPNYASFYFSLDPKEHVLAFTSYAGAKALSVKAVEKFFKTAATWEEVSKEFGQVEADLIKDYGAVEDILNLPHLKELEFIIRPPNNDDIGSTLAAIIEESLREQDADEYEEKLKAKGKKNIKPNKRTRALGSVAAENGEFRAKNLEKGMKVSYNTADKPLTEMEIHTKDASDLSIFRVVAKKIFARISAKREEVRLNTATE